MDDEFESGQEAEPAEAEVEQTADQKLRKENESLRRRLRTFEAAEKYGKEYAEIIPDALPISEWDGWMEKVKAHFQPVAAQPEGQAEQSLQVEVPTVEPTPEEKRLAAITQTGPGTPVPAGIYKAEDALRLALEDPARYKALREAGVIQLAKPPGPD